VTMPPRAVVAVQRTRNVARSTEDAPKLPARGSDMRQAVSPTAQPRESSSAADQSHWWRVWSSRVVLAKSFIGTPANCDHVVEPSTNSCDVVDSMRHTVSTGAPPSGCKIKEASSKLASFKRY